MKDNKWAAMDGSWDKRTSVYPSWCHCSACGPNAHGSTYYQNILQPVNSASLCESCYKTHVLEPSEEAKCDYDDCDSRATYQAAKTYDYFGDKQHVQKVCDNCRLLAELQDHFEPITPDLSQLEPIKKWSDDLVGKRVVCVDTAGDDRLTEGQMGTYSHRNGLYGVVAWDNGTEPTHILPGGLALAPDQPEQGEDKKSGLPSHIQSIVDIQIEPGTIAKMPETTYGVDGEELTIHEVADKLNQNGDGQHYEVIGENQIQVSNPIQNIEVEISWNTAPQPITEVTHSCTLEFPNGDVVEIPEPEGDGWESVIIFDEWTVRDDLDDWGEHVENVYRACNNKIRILEIVDVDYEFYHQSSHMIIDEYNERIEETGPRVLSLTKHIRTYTPAVETEDRYTELDKFPLLNGSDK